MMQYIPWPESPLFIGGPYHGQRKAVGEDQPVIHVTKSQPTNFLPLPPKPKWWHPLKRARWQGRMDAEMTRPIETSTYREERYHYRQSHPQIHQHLDVTVVYVRFFIYEELWERRSELLAKELPPTYRLAEMVAEAERANA